MEQADQEEHFPRTIYDESGRYTISGYGQYEVRSPLIKRYAAVVYIRRDLDSALEMIRACAADEQCPGSPLAKRCLWIRSEERRVGKEWVRTCRSRGWPD